MTTPVSFELAKLLHSKGFNINKKKWWIERLPHTISSGYSKFDDIVFERDVPKILTKEHFQPPNYLHHCPAPTIAEVVMWLYEKHGIWITVYTMDKWSANGNDREQLFDYSLKQMKLGLIDIPKKPEEFNFPTKAYEKAIKYALNNLV